MYVRTATFNLNIRFYSAVNVAMAIRISHLICYLGHAD